VELGDELSRDFEVRRKLQTFDVCKEKLMAGGKF
jgi:hypothetical protein